MSLLVFGRIASQEHFPGCGPGCKVLFQGVGALVVWGCLRVLFVTEVLVGQQNSKVVCYRKDMVFGFLLADTL